MANAFGKKYELKQIVELVWPERDTVILNCPECEQPLATTAKHTIVSIEPLTCPYCRTNHVQGHEGNSSPRK